MKLSDSHKISQEKRDFKISDVLITAPVGVRIPHGPPKKHEILRLVLFLLPDGAISLVQFSAHLFPNLITPPIIDLRVNCKGSTGLCVSGFCGYCRHADIGIGQQNADEGVPEHMRMNFFNARLFSNTAYQCAIAIRVDRKTIVVADHEVVPTQIQKGLCVFGAFLLQILLPACTHQLLLGFPLCIVVC